MPVTVVLGEPTFLEERSTATVDIETRAPFFQRAELWEVRFSLNGSPWGLRITTTANPTWQITAAWISPLNDCCGEYSHTGNEPPSRRCTNCGEPHTFSGRALNGSQALFEWVGSYVGHRWEPFHDFNREHFHTHLVDFWGHNPYTLYVEIDDVINELVSYMTDGSRPWWKDR